MNNLIVTKRYADAYMSYAKDSGGVERAIEDMKHYKRMVQNSPDFEEFLHNPEIGFKEKCQVIDRVMKPEYFEFATRSLLKLLLEKGRIGYIRDICEYIRVTYGHADSMEAHLKSSYPLDLDVLKAIKEGMEKKLHTKLTLYLELDPELLGGIQIRVGNTIFDGSVKRRLTELKEKLMIAEVR